MAKLSIMTDGVVIKEIELNKARTTLGRRPYNDIVVDNLAVSGEHAVLLLHEGQITIEDLNSTNGTYVNGRAARSEPLLDGDLIEIGRYKIRFDQGQATTVANAVEAPAIATVALEPLAAAQAPIARVRVLDGPAAGREAQLVKEVTTLGKPGIAVVSITRRTDGYSLARIGGQVLPRVNGREVDTEPVLLHDQDLIELAESRMQFLLA